MAATTSVARGRGRSAIVGINVTPMVDVVLVLLVIMMVSAQYVVSKSIKVNLPKSSTSDGSQQTSALVTIAADGALSFNGDPVSDDELSAALARAAKEGDVTLVISGDEVAHHGRVVHVMDLARRHDVSRFAVQVREARATP